MEDWHKKLGHLLALERQRRNIEIDEVATDLKITADHLGSIEAGNPKGLPSPLYFDLFAKSYAEYLGIDYAATVQAIREQLEEIEQPAAEENHGRGGNAKPTPRKTAKEGRGGSDEDERDRSAAFRKLAWIIGGAIALLLIFLVINALWLSPGTELPAHEDRAAEEEGGSDVNHVEEASQETASVDWKLPSQNPPEPIVVRLEAHQRSWTEILTDGDTAWQGNLSAGSWVEETAQYRTEISVGVPSQVDVTINGDTVDLRNAKGRIYREDVNQLNLTEVLAGKRPFQTSNIEITTAEDLQATRPEAVPAPPREPTNAETDETGVDEGQTQTDLDRVGNEAAIDTAGASPRPVSADTASPTGSADGEAVDQKEG